MSQEPTPPPKARPTLPTALFALILARRAIGLVMFFAGLAILGVVLAAAFATGTVLGVTHP